MLARQCVQRRHGERVTGRLHDAFARAHPGELLQLLAYMRKTRTTDAVLRQLVPACKDGRGLELLLVLAAHRGDVECCGTLLACGVSADARVPDTVLLAGDAHAPSDTTALAAAAAANHQAVCVLLLCMGADINDMYGGGGPLHPSFVVRPPLIAAIQNGHEALACALLQRGADVHVFHKHYTRHAIVEAAARRLTHFLRRARET